MVTKIQMISMWNQINQIQNKHIIMNIFSLIENVNDYEFFILYHIILKKYKSKIIWNHFVYEIAVKTYNSSEKYLN